MQMPACQISSWSQWGCESEPASSQWKRFAKGRCIQRPPVYHPRSRSRGSARWGLEITQRAIVQRRSYRSIKPSVVVSLHLSVSHTPQKLWLQEELRELFIKKCCPSSIIMGIYHYLDRCRPIFFLPFFGI